MFQASSQQSEAALSDDAQP